ncbi:hypothetical protein J2Z21_005124 [Streptomyces griseochromogenes]|uniref:Uncharacterized protein n=1 Tax=Streptomyces griseochromogenes TaxID=68214 RepID=A0ABS4LY30_9ACTN|nr:hypothetical protein [Streptomyces griseochromogenes]MBP2052142.1 hypothetical protein [Streptomyces griseochromogenes]
MQLIATTVLRLSVKLPDPMSPASFRAIGSASFGWLRTIENKAVER